MLKFFALLALTVALPVQAEITSCYAQRNLVANNPVFQPQLLDPLVRNAWGISIRPAGLGGHFWIANTETGTSSTYVGDTETTPLYQDDLKFVTVVGSQLPSTPTGQTFSGSATDFMVTGEGITGPSRFLWATEDGTISGWAERVNEDGSIARMTSSVVVQDRSQQGAIYKGLTASTFARGNRLYAANFGQGQIEVYNEAFRPVPRNWTERGFERPFLRPADIPGGYAPFNVQYLKGRVFVTYAKTTADPNTEEQGPGLGYVAIFDWYGNHIRTLDHSPKLNAPWGLVIAPADFGPLSGALLVGNFGDGTIVAFNQATGEQLGYLLDTTGAPLKIDGLWGLIFGNGESLGRADYLYFTAGPNGEEDGLFGSLNLVPCL
ncbi:TIGR03118 family protein [Candidatus Cyanaurora vandensis]|uniref:TIGR03118 family protein n=1 Tax=Candidatus Cyanaurora vandensis TaxID=2714958 RepID=UPI00257C0D27|nr:TIGR03118 family protein [Candidatus Cyanaurora vandensis]